MTNTQSFAQRELDILVKSSIDPENRPIIEPFIPEILALCEKFGSSGQSGGSAPYTATALSQAIQKLCLQEPICPITGIDDEWMDVTELSDGQALYQNKRGYAIFKESKDGCAYYLDAIVFKTEKGDAYSSNAGAILKNGSRVCSRQLIKAFPFTPKTFYIDVIEKEIAKDDWELYIKYERQLVKVFKYYDHYTK